MKKYFLPLLASLLLAACNKDDAENYTLPGSVWEFPHRDFMLLKGDVASLTESFSEPSEAEQSYTQLEAGFDLEGRIVHYNPTGVDFSEQTSQRTRGMGVESDAYEYAYDQSGRMSRVVHHILGEMRSIVYTISYGGHERFVPAPFTVMGKPLWLLRGVSAISGSDGYSLRCDGTQVTAEYPEQWNGKQQVTTTFGGAYPSRSVAQTTRRDKIVSTTTTDYTWDAFGRLLRTRSELQIPEEQPSIETTQYDPVLLLSPVKKSYTGYDYDKEQITLIAELVYDYYANGQLSAVRYSVGQGSEWFGRPFTMEYSDPDQMGNWQQARKGIDGAILPITRTLVYR